MKAFMKYPGGKTKELPLINKYKPHEILRYFEPFLGGGSVYLDFALANSYVNDFSKDLISLYICIKNKDKDFFEYLSKIDNLWKKIEKSNFDDYVQNSGFIDEKMFDEFHKKALKKKQQTINRLSITSEKDLELIRLTAKKTALYMCIRAIYNLREENKLHIACYFFLREYCYSSMFRFSSKGDFNVPYGGLSYNKKYMANKIREMKSNEMNLLFQNTKFYNLDFEDFLSHFSFKEGDFIFLDPPYDSDFSTYDMNSFDRNEQIRLRNCLININAKWMLVIKKTDFIYDLYRDFFIYEYDNNYMVSFKNRNEKDVKHLLITNYNLLQNI